MNDYNEHFRDPSPIVTPYIEDYNSTCSGGECPKRDECLYYQNYLKLEKKEEKKYGSATCLSFETVFNSFDTPKVEIYHRFKQK